MCIKDADNRMLAIIPRVLNWLYVLNANVAHPVCANRKGRRGGMFASATSASRDSRRWQLEDGCTGYLKLIK
jgi:hypothetical protein